MLLFAAACKKKEAADTTKPVIDLSVQGSFPVNCDTLYFGEPFELIVTLSDNQELGSFSFDIHHNFDHHSHSTEVTVCTMDPVKTPVNPFVLIEDQKIPAGQTVYQTHLTVNVPAANNLGSYDDGDYHFFISLTDKEGWSTQKGLSIKMLHR
jgi:hypothetical protein